ncbi:MAG TPA: polyprenyl synthetase family protein [Fimbriiglobus sp.]|jgi:octaprenyl-diphosphate synthase
MLANGKLSSRPTALPFGPVQSDLDAADRIFSATLAEYRHPIAPLVQHLKYYRGKRLRPAVLLLAAKACGGIRPAHHTLAAAVEMIHTATLVHDDVLDGAEVRRHVQTIHAGWGEKTAVLMGDMLFTHAFHLTSTVDGRACALIGEATNRVCAGELRQVRERGNLNLTEADYFAMIEGKTAALTECCGRLGAEYAGATPAVADRFARYGRNLGLAFQVADDLLDLTGDENAIGKTLGTDLAQQKLTLPLIDCLNRLPSNEAEELRSHLRDASEVEVDRILEAMTRTGSLVYAKKKAEDFARKAKQELAGQPASDCKNVLELLADWSIRRSA